MPRRSPLKITMSARAAVALGEPFARRGDEFHDPDVALDEVSTLRPQHEAMVLRVEAVGGNKAERRQVAGDWLCLADGAEPRRLQMPRWSCDGGAVAWSASQPSWLDAWERCEVAQWMIEAACAVDPKLMAAAACACARAAVGLARVTDRVVLRALETAEEWAAGSATAAARMDGAARALAREVHLEVAAADAAHMRREDSSALYARSAAMYAAADAAYFVSRSIDGAEEPLGYATMAAEDAALAMSRLAGEALERRWDTGLADVVRRSLPVVAVLSTVTGPRRRVQRR